MVARHIDHARALLGGAQQFLEDLVVLGRPVPVGAQPPAVHDVADEVDCAGTMITEELDETVAPAGARAEMDIGEEQRPQVPLRPRLAVD